MPPLRHLLPLSLIALLAIALLPSAAGAGAGSSTVGASVDYNTPGQAQAYRATNATGGSYNRLSVYLDGSNTASQVELGLYSAGTSGPVTRLARCTISKPINNGWNRCYFTSVTLAAGGTYWVSILEPAGATGVIRYRSTTGTGATFGSAATSLTSLPATWTNGPNWGAQTATLFADWTSTTSTTSTTPAAPTAKYTVSPSSPVSGSPATFSFAGTCAATPCTYKWEDDGSDGSGGTQWALGSGNPLRYTFKNAGTKQVRLTVTDARGRSASTVSAVTIKTASTTTTTTTTTTTSTPTTPTPTTPTTTTTTCNRSATTSTFASQVSAATAGQTICLATGSYGTFTGVNKAITIKAASGATPTMELDFTTGDAGFTLDGLRITGGRMTFGANHITVRSSAFTGPLVMDGLTNSSILIDHDTFNNIMTCSGCEPARIHLSYGQTATSGVTVQYSTFRGGNADGIQAGTGLNILYNEFDNIQETGPSDPAHSDSIQLIGANGAVLRGNYIHGGADGIVAYDGVSNVLIENNVVTTDARPSAIEMYADVNSIIRHNTVDRDIEVNHKVGDPTGVGTQVYDNVLRNVVRAGSPASAIAVRKNNLVQSGAQATEITGKPTWVGPTTTWSGYKLKSGSLGWLKASDGKNIGIN